MKGSSARLCPADGMTPPWQASTVHSPSENSLSTSSIKGANGVDPATGGIPQPATHNSHSVADGVASPVFQDIAYDLYDSFLKDLPGIMALNSLFCRVPHFVAQRRVF